MRDIHPVVRHRAVHSHNTVVEGTVTGLKLALYLAMRDQRVSNSELARRLGLHERVVRRMLDPEHATKAEKIQAALAALGKQMTVEVRDAA
jgi:antitoxin HicB